MDGELRKAVVDYNFASASSVEDAWDNLLVAGEAETEYVNDAARLAKDRATTAEASLGEATAKFKSSEAALKEAKAGLATAQRELDESRTKSTATPPVPEEAVQKSYDAAELKERGAAAAHLKQGEEERRANSEAKRLLELANITERFSERVQRYLARLKSRKADSTATAIDRRVHFSRDEALVVTGVFAGGSIGLKGDYAEKFKPVGSLTIGPQYGAVWFGFEFGSIGVEDWLHVSFAPHLYYSDDLDNFLVMAHVGALYASRDEDHRASSGWAAGIGVGYLRTIKGTPQEWTDVNLTQIRRLVGTYRAECDSATPADQCKSIVLEIRVRLAEGTSCEAKTPVIIGDQLSPQEVVDLELYSNCRSFNRQPPSEARIGFQGRYDARVTREREAYGLSFGLIAEF
ncbi:MAG: hypothetical protein R3B89_34875 [Polyangiaceae bacterium]